MGTWQRSSICCSLDGRIRLSLDSRIGVEVKWEMPVPRPSLDPFVLDGIRKKGESAADILEDLIGERLIVKDDERLT
jgi:hypothetical protein